MLRWRHILLVVAGVLVATIGAAAVPAAPSAGASARAFAIQVYTPDQGVSGTSEAKAPPDSATTGEVFSYPADGSVVSVGSATANASAISNDIAAASAAAQLSDVALFGGEITISQVVAAADARASSAAASGDIQGTSIVGATMNGQAIALAGGGRVQLGDWGYMETLVQTTSGGAAGTKGFHEILRAIDIHVTAAHGGLVAGSEIVIGDAEAFAQASPPADTATIPTAGPPATEPTQTTTTTGGNQPGKPQSQGGHIVKPVPGGVKAKLNRKGYVFPVYGQAWFSDSFGAPRADTGWHHGIDIFAPMGTPLFAVAEGEIFSVGWNNLGGNRLWLRDKKGNEFYYAHLSAYSPLAVNGMRVKAGAVIGFVGNTGDAITTPPHLHFEYHAASLIKLGYDLSARDPYLWLVGLQRLQNVAFPAGTADWAAQIASHMSTRQAGAVLLHSADISGLPRLDRRSLKRLFGTPIANWLPASDQS